MTIVVQGVVFRALPGDGGLRAATNSTSKNNGLACLTRDLAQGNDEFWGNCMRKGSGTPVTPGSPPTPANADKQRRLHRPPLPERHRKPTTQVTPQGSPETRALQGQRKQMTELTVIDVVGVEKLKWKKHVDINQKKGLL